MDKIKILFVNYDQAGVNYFRTQTPAIKLDLNHSDKFQVEINPTIDLRPESYATTMEYLKTFNIIHYHRSLHADLPVMRMIASELKAAGVILIADIDDYWELDKSHPLYAISKQSKLFEQIVDNLKLADYVTTTTDLFADEIKKVVKGAKVSVLPNAVDPITMPQFADKRTPDPKGLVRITYSAGSSHKQDVELLKGVTNILNADQATKGKFKFILAGWDTRGETTDITFNQELAKELQVRGLWNNQMVKAINDSQGNIDLIPKLPKSMVDRYRGKVFFTNKRNIRDDESVYLDYEKIFTDNYRIISDPSYVNFLKQIKNEPYPNEVDYGRRWTRKANVYAEVLNETDISLAPLAQHKFNMMKSNLKQVEAWTRKIPIICSDMPPYNVHGVHMHNCILIPNMKNNLANKNVERDWAKALKQLILDPQLRETLGQNLYDDFSKLYHLDVVTEKRANFYLQAVEDSKTVVVLK